MEFRADQFQRRLDGGAVEAVEKHAGGAAVKKVIVVPGRLVNVVV